MPCQITHEHTNHRLGVLSTPGLSSEERVQGALHQKQGVRGPPLHPAELVDEVVPLGSGDIGRQLIGADLPLDQAFVFGPL